MIDLDRHDRFFVTPRRRMTSSLGTVDVYEFADADADADAPAICHVRRRPSRIYARIAFCTDEALTVPLMHLNPRARFDPWARYELTDPELDTIGEIQKVFVPRRRRSHYVLYGAGGEEVARVEPHIPPAVGRRRVGRVAVVAAAGAAGVPVIGAIGLAAVTSVALATGIRQMRDWVDPIDVASELRVRRGDETLGILARRSLAGTVGPGTPSLPGPWGAQGTVFEIDMTADTARTVDRRLVLAVPVALDVVRGVFAASPHR